jgi:hypothetical protein
MRTREALKRNNRNLSEAVDTLMAAEVVVDTPAVTGVDRLYRVGAEADRPAAGLRGHFQ